MPENVQRIIFINLGLGEAKFVTSRGRNANGAWTIWSDGAVELMGTSGLHIDGLATITFPIALPALSRYISLAERLSTDNPSGNNVHVSVVLEDTISPTGFKARCQLFDGRPSSSSFSWRVMYAPV